MTYTPAGLNTRLVWSALDSLIWIGSLVIATWLRLDFHITDQYWTPLLVGSSIAVLVHLLVGWAFGPYAVGHELGSFEETSDLSRAAVVAGIVLGVLDARRRCRRPAPAACPSRAWPSR